MTAEQKQILLSLGMKELFMHNVPFGAVLNAATFDSFLLISSGSFLTPDKKYMLNQFDDDDFMVLYQHITAPSGDGKQVRGTFDYCISFLKGYLK